MSNSVAHEGQPPDMEVQAKNMIDLLQARLDYIEYLGCYENRPFIAGCTGPMGFDEFLQVRKPLAPLLNDRPHQTEE